mmetsp:Transcript_42680/g.83906  ORF Transcript_42680/g.83906 Transcript_42680/m.83906 type:complete len:115 (-) Transcript_42680:209-553(-)
MDTMDTKDIRMLAVVPNQVEKGKMVKNTIFTKDIVEINAKKSVVTTMIAQALNGTKRRSVRYGTMNRITSGLNGLKGQKDLTVTGGNSSGAFGLTTIEGALMPAVASNTLLSRL